MIAKLSIGVLSLFFLSSQPLGAAEDKPLVVYYSSADGNYQKLESSGEASLALAKDSRVAIGTTKAGAKLTVEGNLQATGQMKIEGDASVIHRATAAGGMLAKGGLVIEKRDSDPTPLENGRLWLDTRVTSS